MLWRSVAVSTRQLYQQTLALTSPTNCGRSAGVVCSRTKATDLLVAVKSLINPVINSNSHVFVVTLPLDPDNVRRVVDLPPASVLTGRS
jgi:hypothetical protein